MAGRFGPGLPRISDGQLLFLLHMLAHAKESQEGGARIAIIIAGIWVASPIDLIPEFLPVIGPLDDIVVVALALRYAGRQVPRDVLLGAWPGDPRLMERLLGPARPAP